MTAATGGIRVAPRPVGAALGAGISLSAALVLAGFAEANALRGFVASEVLAFGALGAGIGVPVGALLGWIHTPAAVSSQGSARVGLVARLATLAVLLGAAVLSIVMAFGGLLASDVWGPADAAASFVMLFTFGLMIFGLPAWALAAVVCTFWVMLLDAAAANEQSDDGHPVTPVSR